MRTTITIPDTLFGELMSFTEAGSRTEAVQLAVENLCQKGQARAASAPLEANWTLVEPRKWMKQTSASNSIGATRPASGEATI